MPSIYVSRPEPLFEIRAHVLDLAPTVRGLCAGYESGVWRNEDLAGYLFEYLPDFALRHGELGPVGHAHWANRLALAARTVYSTKKFQRRGEFGELMLHAVIRELWGSEPAVSKIYYKDGPNETVKGFDAVHVVLVEGEPLELLLGEVKFYKSIDRAMTDVAKELREHFGNDEWLKSEFLAVTRKLDDEWPHAVELEKLLHRRRSLDEIVQRIRVPVLLTYESPTVAAATVCDEVYQSAFAEEVGKIRDRFAKRKLPKDLVIDLVLVPIHQKKDLLAALERRLEAWKVLAQ